MNRDEAKDLFLTHKGAWEDYPFDDVTAVFKVGSKMFGLMSAPGKPLTINLKCDPDLAADLRDVYEDIMPGYHMSKRHWNTVNVQGSLPAEEIVKMIEHSYQLVLKSLPKRERETILNSD